MMNNKKKKRNRVLPRCFPLYCDDIPPRKKETTISLFFVIIYVVRGKFFAICVESFYFHFIVILFLLVLYKRYRVVMIK